MNIILFLIIIIVILLCAFITLLILFFASPKAMNNRKLYSSFGELKELLSNYKIPEITEDSWQKLKKVAEDVTKHMLIDGEHKGENFQNKVVQDTKNILSPLDITIEDYYTKGRADLVFRSNILTIVVEVKAKTSQKIQKSEFQKVEDYVLNLEADFGLVVVLDSDYSKNRTLYQKWMSESQCVFVAPETIYYPFLQLIYSTLNKMPKIDPDILYFEKTRQYLQNSLSHNIKIIDRLNEEIRKNNRKYQKFTDELLYNSDQMISKLNKKN